jgi:hypothetical protein
MNEKYGARYDVMVNYIPQPEPLTNAGGLHPRVIRRGYPAPPVKLVMDLREEEDSFAAVFTYDSYSRATMENWAAAFRAILLREPVGEIIRPAESTAAEEGGDAILPAFAEVWSAFFGAARGSFYEQGGTSLMAIQIEEAMLLRGFYVSAADILQTQDFTQISKLVISADDIDWETQ